MAGFEKGPWFKGPWLFVWTSFGVDMGMVYQMYSGDGAHHLLTDTNESALHNPSMLGNGDAQRMIEGLEMNRETRLHPTSCTCIGAVGKPDR